MILVLVWISALQCNWWGCLPTSPTAVLDQFSGWTVGDKSPPDPEPQQEPTPVMSGQRVTVHHARHAPRQWRILLEHCVVSCTRIWLPVPWSVYSLYDIGDAYPRP